MTRPLLLTLLIILLSAPLVQAQSSEFQIANRLMQQNNYEEALPILEELYSNNPGAYVFFERYVEALTGLERYDEAVDVVKNQIREERSVTRSKIRLAEILHLRGNREEALEQWAEALSREEGDIQTYYNVATSMNNRREFDEAIKVFTRAREQLNNRTLFLNEMGNTYMRAGRFEEAVTEFYRMVLESPEQMGVVQQRFLQMRDQQLYQIASFELEDLLFEIDVTHASYSQLYQLLIWLFLETGEYDRAENFARHYERQTSHTIYSLFSLGSQLFSAGEFEPAARAFEYYVDEGSGSNRLRAMEELALTYSSWARNMEQHNLESEERWNELYRKSYQLNEQLLEEAPSYDRAHRIFTNLLDLSLDRFKNHEAAKNWFERMKDHPSAEEAYIHYAEGRLALFDQNYTQARQSLTRADRATDSSNLSERSRYYLSLSDFFAGDYEFAEIQLRSLERRHTSFYANDAIKLRMWIKNGQRADTTGSVLNAIGRGLFSAHKGEYENSLPYFEPIVADPSNPFADDIVAELSAMLPSEYNHTVLWLLERQVESRPNSPQLERLMWDRATLAETLWRSGRLSAADPAGRYSFMPERLEFDYDEEKLAELYEELLMLFPDGFYAQYAREKLREMETRISMLML
ncbi:MAG: tetratricopeptide repeat protein [Balneolaceae bacterium]|nr:tetratricopeptide repeat protein [Balneolaceae bacterium]MCH8548645.1 tetratricopeptide repeat protein [Balneolaceae bacterium]